MFTALVAPPGVAPIRTPGALPYNAVAKLGVPASVSCCELMVLTAYPSAFCFLPIPREVTTTSSRALLPDSRTIIAVFSAPKAISLDANPTNDTTNVALGPTLIENAPVWLVTTLFLVPFSVTLAPASSTPALSLITPVTVRLSCACSIKPLNRSPSRTTTNCVFDLMLFKF